VRGCAGAGAAAAADADQLRDQFPIKYNIQDTGQEPRRPKAAVLAIYIGYWMWILARFKGNNTRRPLFLSACVGMALVNNTSARKKSRREVGGPAQRLQAAVEQLTGFGTSHPHP
jgi:hypothetical protein